MASFNGTLTVEDSSPLITYAPAGSWVDSPPDDPLLPSYEGGSYHATSSQNATASFSFVGTGVSIFGGRRPNYGAYTVSVDGHDLQNPISQPNQGLTQTHQILASTTGLSYGNHTVILTNAGGGPVDIDFIDFEIKGGPSGSSFSAKDFDNLDPAVTYAPSSDAWQNITDSESFDGTFYSTQTPGASASMSFTGGAVALYGAVGPQHANIIIHVDGQEVTLPGGANGFASSAHPGVLLYYRGDLDGTEHTITMSAASQPGTGPFIDLDRITVFNPTGPSDSDVASLPSSAPASTAIVSTTLAAASTSTSVTAAADMTLAPSSSPANSNSSGTSSHTSTGLIVGSVVGGVGALFVLLATAILLCLRRRRQRSARLHKSMIAVSPVLPIQDKPVTPILPMQTTPFDVERGGTRRLEATAFPFPAPKRSLTSLRYPAPSTYSGTTPSHSRDPSELSNGSTVPLVQSVPVISAPQPRPNVARKPAPGLPTSVAPRPVRPTNRPPTIDFTHISEVPR